ncbi:hypothetical protein RM872_004107 [Shigella flexneri]|nr:hypothetical protein [Shigella flexneri]
MAKCYCIYWLFSTYKKNQYGKPRENSISNLLFVICYLLFVICYFLFFLSSFNEQIAVVNVLLCTTLLIFCKTNNYNTKPLLNAMGISLLVIIYIATCTGNKVRYYAEIEHWFKEYGNFNIIQRSMLGLNLYADMLFSVKSIIPALLAFSSTIICKKKTKILPLISCCILITLYIIHTPPVIFQAIHFSESNLFSTLSVFRVSFAMILTALIIFPTVISLNFNVTSIFISTMIIGTIATTSMLGLSPSIYASGNRIYFIPYLLLITAIVVSTPIAINNIVANLPRAIIKFELNLKATSFFWGGLRNKNKFNWTFIGYNTFLYTAHHPTILGFSSFFAEPLS